MKASQTVSWRIAGRSLPNCPGAAARRPRETIAMVRKSKHEDEFGSRVAEFAMAGWDLQCTPELRRTAIPAIHRASPCAFEGTASLIHDTRTAARPKGGENAGPGHNRNRA